MPISLVPQPRFPRRALLGLPVVAGICAALYRRETPLPDATAQGSGPDVRLTLFSPRGEAGKPVRIRSLIRSDKDWAHDLTGEEFSITRRQGTEFAFTNRYWNFQGAGLYRCVCCGTALFRSEHKFDSGTGWPSFTAPCATTNIQTAKDTSYSLSRTEVMCRKCDAHLGHLFDDGPPPAGLRYCMNSAALRFVAYQKT